VRHVWARRACALAAGALLLAGCGGASGESSSTGDGGSSSDAAAAAPASAAAPQPTTSGNGGSLTIRAVDPSRYLRGSSVGRGMGPAPAFAPTVRRAARAARCRLRADISAGRNHVANPDYSLVPRPPTNGPHRPIWANWGFYTQPIPYAYEVHNLEHGAVVIHLGLRVPRAAGTNVVRLWAASPPYMLVVPGLPADVPQRGATITSWQRAMICPTTSPRVLTAIRTYRDAYRGTGPEQIPSLDSGATARDLPTPALPDPTG
jgi:uncharacterized protein DUF3105